MYEKYGSSGASTPVFLCQLTFFSYFCVRMKPKNIAILLAGGSGTRFGADCPKQFLTLGDGLTVLEHCIRSFHASPLIDRIVIAVREDYIAEVKRIVRAYPKITDIVAGGRERYESSTRALEVCTGDDDLLLFHDAVRPFVSADLIRRLVEAAEGGRCVAAAMPATDTIVRADNEGRLVETLRRSELWCMQTPQCFPRHIIAKAYRCGLSDDSFAPTDDCGVVRRYLPEVPVHLIPGEAGNIKITYPEDLR